MTDGTDGGHGRGTDPAASAERPVDASDDTFARPPGVSDTFAPREQAPLYTPAPPTVSPEEHAVFGRPQGAGPFHAAPGERIPPRHSAPPPVHPDAGRLFGPGEAARDGFEPAPGTRLGPRREVESPWWKPDAPVDPWRDPASAYWLGSGAIFTDGRPGQLAAESDAETEPPGPVEDGDEDDATAEKAKVVPLRRRFGLSTLAIVVLVAVLAGAIGGGAGYLLTRRTTEALHNPDISIAKTGKPANRPPGSVAAIAKKVGPAVVSITVSVQGQNGYAVGSGVVIDKGGYVLTNNHVVQMGAQSGGRVVVTFSDEATATARIVGRDPIADLAVIKVPDDHLTVASLGDSSALQVGDPVIALGSPLALQGTVTEGIVSTLSRAVSVPSEDGTSTTYLDAIQTDAAINPGNSGGALVAADGSVVGINTAGISGSGIGFAIPIDYARGIAQQLIRTGKVTHAGIGASGRSAQTSDGLASGAYLVQVEPGGPAAKAGLKAGDVVVAAGGRVVEGNERLQVIVQEAKPGQKITVVYYRGSTKKTAIVTLGTA